MFASFFYLDLLKEKVEVCISKDFSDLYSTLNAVLISRFRMNMAA